MNKINHPGNPRSNITKFTGYDPNKYALADVSMTVRTDEGLTPGRPPCLTQQSVGKYLVPLTKELAEVSPSPTIDELPYAVIDRMVTRDKAFWVDKPGANAYTLHDAYNNYGMTTEGKKNLPSYQAVFPRSYQYDLDCVRYRRQHAYVGLKQPQAWSSDPGQRRWRYYPDLQATLTSEEIRKAMNEVGRPFQNEACNWYYKNYPSAKYECIMRKFSK